MMKEESGTRETGGVHGVSGSDLVYNLCIENCVDGSAFVQIEFIIVSGCALIRR